MAEESKERAALISTETAAHAAGYGTSFVNNAYTRITEAQRDGPLTFRMLGFIGGLAMTVSNALSILDRFFSFNFAGSLLAVYGVFFGLVITTIEGPGPCARRLDSGIRYYAKFLEYTWGRGALYFFVGSLQASNWNMLDWAVGGFMMFVGVTAIGVGIATAADLKKLKQKLATEASLKEKWDEFDKDKNGVLDVKELTALTRSFDLTLTKNEIAAMYLALDRNFDEKITYEELFSWWAGAGAYGADRSYSV